MWKPISISNFADLEKTLSYPFQKKIAPKSPKNNHEFQRVGHSEINPSILYSKRLIIITFFVIYRYGILLLQIFGLTKKYRQSSFGNWIDIHDTQVYYTFLNSNSIFMAPHDGSSTSQTIDEKSSGINVDDGTIFYIFEKQQRKRSRSINIYIFNPRQSNGFLHVCSWINIKNIYVSHYFGNTNRYFSVVSAKCSPVIGVGTLAENVRLISIIYFPFHWQKKHFILLSNLRRWYGDLL
jgi:hypothetical protein